MLIGRELFNETMEALGNSRQASLAYPLRSTSLERSAAL